MAFCRNCGKEIGEAKFCPECGTPVAGTESKAADSAQAVSPPPKTPNMPPMPGQAWQPPRKKNHGCLITFLVVLGVVLFAVVMLILTTRDQQIGTTEFTRGQIVAATKASNEKAQGIESILKSCDVEPIAIIYDDILDYDNLWGYRIKTKEGANVIMYTTHDHQVSALKYADYYLYQNGEQLLKLSQFMMSLNEKSNIQYASQEAIKSILKSPSTAKFPLSDQWNIWKTPDEIVVQSYVDSQNGFGAEIRSEFQIKYSPEGNITSCIFDGTELIQ